MAKAKAKANGSTAGGDAPRKKPGPEPTGRKPTALTIKGSGEWKAWLEEAAAHCRLPVSSLVDLAVAEYVQARGFKEAPPKR